MMKKTIIFLALLIFAVYVFTQAPDWQWVTQANGGNTEIGNGIIIDDLGNTYVTGHFQETATFGTYSLTSNGLNDIFVAKIDESGNWQWATHAGGSNSEYGYSITIDDVGNTYVTGFFSGTATFGTYSLTSSGSVDIFVAKVNENGTWEWATKAGGSSWDCGYGISINDDGDNCVTGYFSGSATFGTYSLTNSGDRDIFVAKIDTNGIWQWATKAGGSDSDYGFAITNDNIGNSYVTGNFANTAAFSSYFITSSGSGDVFVAMIDANGTWQWVTQAGGIDFDRGNAITLDDSGNTYISGFFADTATFDYHSITSNGDRDIFVAKMNASGTWLWASQAGGSEEDYGKEITIDNAGSINVIGYFSEVATFGSNSLISSGGYDIFVSKMDSSGDWQWSTQAGGSEDDSGNGITIDDAGNSYVTGFFQGTASFGFNSLTSTGDADIFVAKIEESYAIANFEADSTSGYFPLTVNFSDLSVGNLTNWYWDFENDGTYDSYDQNPTFTYNNVGIYDVKLKISNETCVDSLIKQNYITVVYVPPASPESVQVNIVYPDAIISWSAVDTTIFGDPITPDGYIVLYSENEVNYFYLFSTTDTTYTHIRVAEHRDQMFYQVVAYINYTREQIEYLVSLNNSQETIKWMDVKRKLNATIK